MSIPSNLAPVALAHDLRELFEIWKCAFGINTIQFPKGTYCLQSMTVLLQIQKDKLGAGGPD